MALRFNEQPYNFNEGGNILAQFRGRGWAVLRNVFDRESVDAFRELLLSRCDPPATAEVGARYVLPDDAPGGHDAADGRVCISTIHRAKGLEWSDVYSPLFNQGLFPTEFIT